MIIVLKVELQDTRELDILHTKGLVERISITLIDKVKSTEVLQLV